MAVELDVDRSLINPHFDTYHLKRDIEWNTTYSTLPDEARVQRYELTEDDYSYSHMAMATSINHLHQDPHHSTNLYLIDSKGCIISCSGGKVLKTLFHIPGYNSKSYASLAFPSKSLALVLLSTRTDRFSSEIFVVRRNLPSANYESWDHYKSFTPPESLYGGSELAQSSHLHVFDTFTLDEDDESLTFVCGSINQKERVGTKSPFCTVLHWFTVTSGEEGWSVTDYRRLVGDGLRSDWVKMAQLDKTSRHLVVVGEGRFKLENVIEDDQRLAKSQTNLSPVTNSNSPAHQFLFSQTLEEVTLRICLSPAINPKRDLQISVDFRPKYLKVSLKGTEDIAFEELHLEGELEQSIVPDGSTWTISKDGAGLNYLEITLEKYSKGLSWFGNVVNIEHSTLINCRIMVQPGHLGVQTHEEIEMEMDKPQEDDKDSKDERIANIEKGLEECDYQDAYTSLVLTYRDMQSGSVHREYDLSSQQWLCHLPRASVFVMRHDVDAFIYRLTSQGSAKHVATFDALGYIQASKTNKRFLTFTDNFTHAVIANAERQVYIYWKTSEANVGNHAIFNLDCKESIHGLQTVGLELYILTDSRLYRLQLKR